MGVVVHLPLRKRLRRGLIVLDRDDRKGEIVGFRRQRSWAFRRPQMLTFVVVDFGAVLGRRYMSPGDLRVVELSTEGGSGS